jgi:Uma2 family endonuclease
MAEVGLFEGKHVELIEGQVIEMTPTGSLHATAVALAARRLEKAFGAGYFVRWQMPLVVTQNTELEPDLAIVRGYLRDYKDSHPTTAALIVEVAESSLLHDRTKKAEIYARAGIADYWILNLNDRQLEVHRNPQASSIEPSGFAYRDVTVLTENDVVSPLGAPQEIIAVADLLP